MRLYVVNDEYIRFLRKIDSKVLKNKEERDAKRPYVGIIVEINNYKYLVPLSSPKYKTDFFVEGYDGKELPDDFPNREKFKIIMKYRSSVPVMYLNKKFEDGNIEMLGKLKFSSMIPVPLGTFKELCVEQEQKEYRNLLNKQIRYIQAHKKEIIHKHAKVIYREKEKNIEKAYIKKSTVYFKSLENGCQTYAYKQMSIGLYHTSNDYFEIINKQDIYKLFYIENGFFSRIENLDVLNNKPQKIKIYAKNEFNQEKCITLTVKIKDIKKIKVYAK